MSHPDERRDFPHGHIDMMELTGISFGKATFEPGWRWSQDVKPVAGTGSCMFPHRGFVAEGRMHIRMDDGEEADLGPGDAMVVSPGHDAWVIGDEPCVLYDFATEATDYAKPKGT